MLYDIIIIGGGPAGLTAALYARRASKTVLVLEKAAFGGQITYSPKVENIPGRSELSGNDFAAALVDQVIDLGAELEPAEVIGIKVNPDGTKTVIADDGERTAKAVIIASGAEHRRLGIPGEEELIGSGISFCAVCDGAFYRGKTVGVVGGGNSALQEALLLSDLAEKVYVVQNLDHLTGEAALQSRLAEKLNVEVITGSVVDSFLSDGTLSGIKIKKNSGETRELKMEGLFVAIGLEPKNQAFADIIDLDAFGYADIDESTTTRTPGIFAAGDCRKKRIRQVTTACSDGAVAALAAVDYCDSF